MKKNFALIIILCIAISLSANDISSKHSLSLNLGGPRSLGYFEYQYKAIAKEKNTLSISTGMGMQSSNITLPIGITYTYGNKSQILLGLHYVPILGYRYYYLENSLFEYLSLSSGSARIGYRRNFSTKQDDFFIQIFFSPTIDWSLERQTIYTSIGVGFGVNL